MKKTYSMPTCEPIYVEVESQLAQVSAKGNASESFPKDTENDVKSHSSYNVWEEDWSK